MRDITWIPAIQVRYRSLLLYYYPDTPLSHKRTVCTTRYTGKVTASTKKRIMRTVDILLQKSPLQSVINPITQKVNQFQLTFITLTISAINPVCHKEAYKKGLARFLDWMRYKGCTTYIWKAELQKRGQIHYHITTNKFIRYDELQKAWNSIQRKAGWLDDYYEKHKRWNANSTDIHAVHKVHRLDLYIAKYISKVSDSGLIKGKVWGCSKDLQGAKYYSYDCSPDELDPILNDVTTGVVKQVKLDKCVVFNCDDPLKYLSGSHSIYYRNHIK